ncbi:pilus assembly protein [Pseudomonas sp. SCB32]|uniref:pilus assembly protein n=1 Tax=Pseudomonas sp. SCB32 TaxID=2653853 RepID=UPI0012641810|nr:PilC/PilY family type IV pilus protein [Pseudomonas sp. SCB32]
MKTQDNVSALGRVSALCMLLLAGAMARADDIDLFVGTPPNAADAPNVLIVLDNTANWNTPFTNEKAALVSVINGLQANKFRVGLMMFTESGGGNKGDDGGYVRAAIRLFDAPNKTKYQALVNSLDVGADKSNGGKISKTMEEAWLYYSAGVPNSGNQKVKTDYTGNNSGTASSNAIYALSGNALSSVNGSPYNNPIVTGCANNFIIYISNGAAQDNTNDLKQATSALSAAGGNTTAIPISPSGSQDNMADEWARFMKKSTLGITTYTVDIDKVTTGQGPGWTALLKSMANVSGGKYFDVTASGTQISDALNAIFSEIQATNSVFASVTLPVSVNTQSTYLNQVFVGMFRPDADSFPRWAGNLKQYKLGMVNGKLQTVDADGNSAINSATGFITECARSFWTPTTTDSYWTFKPQGNCLTVLNSDVSNYPDGNIVEKGAQAYMLRQASTRTMKTCPLTGCTTLTDFNTSNAAITQALLGAADATERSNIISWALGADNQDENTNGNLTEMRPSVHGDIVHSRPAAINYGNQTNPKVVVYYGGNDGLLHAINGNRTGNIGSVTPGSELWSFMPPEFYPSIKRLRDNAVTISFPGHTTGTPTPQPKSYGMDGSVSTVQQNGSTWIYAAMRRGGRSIYAFDVSSSTASPTLKWKLGCPNMTNDTGCSSGFSGIGQTWATPKAFTAAGYNSGTSTILAMGGGYDACEDNDPNTCISSNKGNKIYLMDADTGALLNTFTTDRGVVGDVTMVTDNNGQAMYGYAADLGGNVYRLSGVNAASAFGNTAPANWTMTKIASLGCDTASSCTANRKFMYGPEVAVSNGQYVIALGSGDREKPLLSYTSAAAVSNRFYSLRDNPADSTWLTSENATCGANVICNASLLAITTSATPSAADLATKPKGWYLALQPTEQVVTSALVLFDTIIFSTHQPAVASATSCVSLGTARNYDINYKNAAGSTGDRFSVISGGGLAPSPVAGIVILDDGTQKPFIIGGGDCATDSSLQGCEAKPPAASIRPKSWVFWNIEQ